MKATFQIAVVASLALTGSAEHHNHARHHRHAKRDMPSRVDKRDAIATVVEQGPTVTVYQVAGGDLIPADEAESGLLRGEYVVIGSTNPEADFKPDTSPSNGIFKEGFEGEGGEEEQGEERVGILEVEESSSVVPADPLPSSSSAAVSSEEPATSSIPPAAGPSVGAPPPVLASSNMLAYDAVGMEFPDNVYDCSVLPGGFGAVAADYLDMSGWLGIQWGYHDILTGVRGDTCTPGAHCTYLCPEGYEKSQWPERQGDKHESIGGLYCNDNNKLVKSRPGISTLCQKGRGGVSVTNSLSETVYMCRTDYPGTEAMLIPVAVEPGTTHEVTNPSQTDYLWKGMKTSAQYYLNNPGLNRDQACTWDSDHLNIYSAGDKAPTNFGTGEDAGTTYFSIFPNSAVSTAVLQYNVRISVNGQVTCTLIDGQYSTSPTGCTGGSNSGNILMEFF